VGRPDDLGAIVKLLLIIEQSGVSPFVQQLNYGAADISDSPFSMGTFSKRFG
jgi:hypothetical protein